MTNRLSRSTHPGLTLHPERMIQFGEGNFMRAFVDWQLQQMNNLGLFNGSAVLIQPIEQGPGESADSWPPRTISTPCC